MASHIPWLKSYYFDGSYMYNIYEFRKKSFNKNDGNSSGGGGETFVQCS